MAGDWIKMRWNLAGDPDVIEIAAATKLDEFGVIGRLHAVWSWLDQHSADGTNVRIVSAFLDRLTACPGFAEAMRTVGWLTGRDGSLTFPGYEVHNGESAKLRASETKRKQAQRNGQRGRPRTRDKCPDDDGTNVPDIPGLEKRREEIDNTHTAREGVRGWSCEAVKAAGDRVGIPEEVCKAYHDDREGAGWIDAKGRAIVSMPHDLATFWRHWQSRDAEKASKATGRSKGSGAPADRPPTVWELKQRIEAAEKEIGRLQWRKTPEAEAEIKVLKGNVRKWKAALAGGNES
jgi:hypothetical protein